MADSEHSAATRTAAQSASQSGRVRVWLADSASEPELLHSLPAQLSDSSRGRFEALSETGRRLEFLLGRRLLVHAVRQFSGTRLEFAEIDDSGHRPRLPPALGLECSLAHSRGEVAVALAHCRLGLDLECFDVDRELLPLARRLFLPAEQQWLKVARSPKALRQRFHRIWTAREAAYKCGLLDLVTGGPAWVQGGEWAPPWPTVSRLTASFCLTVVANENLALSVVRARLRETRPEPELGEEML